jgi:hypothetical protein
MTQDSSHPTTSPEPTEYTSPYYGKLYLMEPYLGSMKDFDETLTAELIAKGVEDAKKQPQESWMPTIFWEALRQINENDALRNLDMHIEVRDGKRVAVPNKHED